MSTPQPDPDSSSPAHSDVEQHDPPEEPQYHTVSGVTVEISDIEVDVVDNGVDEVMSSQADPQAYGIEPGENDTPGELPDTAPS